MSERPDDKHDENDLPGMLGVAKGVAEQRWPHTMDATAWADEFAKVKPENINYSLMLGWFANAIMAGYDTARARAAPPNGHCSLHVAQGTQCALAGHCIGNEPTIQVAAASAPSSIGTFEDYWKSVGRPDYSPSARSIIEDAFKAGQRTVSAIAPNEALSLLKEWYSVAVDSMVRLPGSKVTPGSLLAKTEALLRTTDDRAVTPCKPEGKS